jgi:hypothetical protein
MAMNLDLSDPDAWDDSALTNSWNEALQEYKACPEQVNVTCSNKILTIGYGI